MPEQTQAPICPGCHFGCALDDYQCGRGARFYDMWKAGEEIPTRRGPGGPGGGPRGDKGSHGGPSSQDERGGGRPPHVARMPVSARLRMLLNIYGHINRDHELAYADRRVAECILRQDGHAANGIIAERTGFSFETIDECIDKLNEGGIVRSARDERGRVFHELTQEGRAQTEDWIAEHQAGDEAFFSELDADEQDQLEALLAKLLQPHMRRGR